MTNIFPLVSNLWRKPLLPILREDSEEEYYDGDRDVKNSLGELSPLSIERRLTQHNERIKNLATRVSKLETALYWLVAAICLAVLTAILKLIFKP